MLRFSLPTALALCTALLALPAFAGNNADEAEVAFKLGNREANRRDYEKALSHYFLSYRLVQNRNVLLNIARCYETLERFDEAYRYFNDMLALEPAEEDRSAVNQALARIRPKVALVHIQTEPPGAEIFVDREDLGSRGHSPQTLALEPGEHLLRVSKDGYHSAEDKVLLVRGQEISRGFSLEERLGEVEITGTPEGALIRQREEGPVIALLPGTVRLPPGKTILFISAKGFVPVKMLVEVPQEETGREKVTLTPEPAPSGRLVLTANRDEALIRVDGQEAGFTPMVLQLPEGTHHIEVSTSEARSWAKDVPIPKDGEVRLHAELRYAPPEVRVGSRMLLPPDQAPASITVLTREQIRAFGYPTLAAALQAVRGFFVTDDRQYLQLGVRGVSPPGDLNSRILILYDGHAMNDVWAGQGFVGRDFDVDLEEVERIEVVRGPGSALYGTGAFFAVINVVSREALLHPGAALSMATFGTGGTRGRITGAFSGNGASALVSAAASTMAGAESTLLPDVGVVRGLDTERVAHFSLRAHLDRFTLLAGLNARSKDVPTAPYETVVGAPGTQVNDIRGFAELRYERTLGNADFSARVAYDASRYRGYWQYAKEDHPPDTLTDAARADWLSAEVGLRLNPFASHQLILGIESQLQLRVEQEVLRSKTPQSLQTNVRNILSAYAHDEWSLHPNLTLSLGLRVDRFSDLDRVPFSPRVALIGTPYPGGLTKLMGGSAFRAPTSYELYYQDFNRSQLPATSLAPEWINTFELEHSHELTEEVRVTVAGYFNRISNLMVLLPNEDPEAPRCGTASARTPCLAFQNAPGLVQSVGAEAEVHWQPGRFTLVDVSYSYVWLLDPSQKLQATHPTHLLTGRILVPLGSSGVRFCTQAVYQSAWGQGTEGERPGTGEALLIRVGFSGEMGMPSELGLLRWFVGADNLLDVHYALPTGLDATSGPPLVQQYGRTFAVQVSTTF